MRIDIKDIDGFFEKSGIHQESIKQMDHFIMEHLPIIDRKLYITDTICTLGYGEIPYRNTNYSGTIPIISLAPQKNNVSFYVMAWKDGQALAEIYSSRLGKVSTGKACIRFKKFTDLQLDELQKLLMDVAQIYQDIKNKEGQR